MITKVLQGYAASADELIARYESVSADQLYAPVVDFLPQRRVSRTPEQAQAAMLHGWQTTAITL